jgi:hypothetical protein
MTDRTDDEPRDLDGPDTTNATEDDLEDPGWPWSFILLVVAGAIYLIFRFAEVAINLLN